ncbi:MAG TPA: thiamine pyrophosphate-dependent enzyme, partial [Acidimicrobiales bacterium]|nr:thiamine pyrophosphate-dependent enzyme [Acidimicrobiales bacterium]
LVALAEARRAGEPRSERERIAARRSDLEVRHRAVVEEGRAAAGAGWDRSPVSTARLASELWEVVQGLDWVLTGSDLNGWIDRLWDIDRWERFPGRSLGTGTQLGTAMGVALAYRGTGKVVVDVQPDGDLLFDPGALWTIRRYGLALLVVMFNNRSYYNDVPHQVAVAAARGRDTSAAHTGMDLDDPPPDFAALARSFGWFGVGPIERPEALRAGLSQGLEVVHEQGRPALVDVVTQVR